MLNPFDIEARLAQHKAATEQVERQGWMLAEHTRERRSGRTRDRIARLLLSLAARVDPDALQVRMQTAERTSRL